MRINIGTMYGVSIIFEDKSIKKNKTKKSKALKGFQAAVDLLKEQFYRDEKFVAKRNN